MKTSDAITVSTNLNTAIDAEVTALRISKKEGQQTKAVVTAFLFNPANLEA